LERNTGPFYTKNEATMETNQRQKDQLEDARQKQKNLDAIFGTSKSKTKRAVGEKYYSTGGRKEIGGVRKSRATLGEAMKAIGPSRCEKR